MQYPIPCSSRSRLARLARSCLLGSLLAGCEDLSDWKTGPNEVFRGEVSGSDTGSVVDSFIRKGFESHTLLDLTFDPNSAEVIVSGDAGETARRTLVAGTVDTYLCPPGLTACDRSERIADGPFRNAPLVTIDAITHDPLSQYTFPGGGRLRNYMFGVHFVSETRDTRTGRDAMLFVSLMENDHIEVRALAPSVLARDAQEEVWPALFGVFTLARAPAPR
ncbi:MAG: hypothetical protein ABW321_16190 [Polyangiales bacterium]